METDDEALTALNARRAGFNDTMQLRFTSLTPQTITAEVVVASCHLQPYGLVHGGVYASMIETLCSTGAALSVRDEARHAVGLENNTSFLRAVRSGTLRGVARPLSQGRRSQVWSAEIHDDQGRLVATGRVRLLVLEDGATAAGQQVGLLP